MFMIPVSYTHLDVYKRQLALMIKLLPWLLLAVAVVWVIRAIKAPKVPKYQRYDRWRY